MPRPLAFTWTVILLVLLNGTTEAQTSCKEITLRDALTENRADLFKGTLGALGSGLLLYAERNGETAVVVGSLLLFSKEFSDFASSASNRQHLEKFNGLDPDSKLQSCLAPGTLASTLGFQSLTILRPVEPLQFPRRGKSLSDAIRETVPDSTAPPTVSSAFQKNILDRIGQMPSSTLAPLNPSTITGRASSVAPAAIPALRPSPLAKIGGTVRDGDSGYRLPSAFVTLVRPSAAQGGAQSVFTQSDGSFEFDYIAAGQYVLTVSQPGYAESSILINAPGNTTVSLRRTPTYPCDFTVINMTGWGIFVGPNGAQPLAIPPYQAYTARLFHPDTFSARANFVDASPLTWGPISAQCGDPGYIRIVP